MKKLLTIFLGLTIVLAGATAALALPFLQLDASNATYDNGTETVVTSENPFELYALVDPSSQAYEDNTIYYLSVALLYEGGSVTTAGNYGSILIDGDVYDVTSDMVLGTPPIEVTDKDLATHGIFDTFYTELSFKLDTSNMANAYNVQDNPGGFELATAGNDYLYFELFNFDISGLNDGFDLHFDLYTLDLDGNRTGIDKFAPFSHDAETRDPNDPPPPNTVPEPATMLLLGMGLFGVGIIRRKQNS